MTGEQVRWGLENLNLTQTKLDALGFAGVMRPISTSCVDHMGATWARIHTWDGKKWNFTSDWLQADEQIIKPLVKATADKYAAEKKIDAAHAGGLPVLTLTRGSPRERCDRSVARDAAMTSARPRDHDMSAVAPATRPQRQRHRGHLQPRDPGAQGRVAAGARRAASWPCSAATARARPRRCAPCPTCSRASAARSPRAAIELRGERIEKPHARPTW